MDEFIIPVGVDASGITKGFDAALASIEQFTKNAQKQADQVAETFLESGASVDDLNKKVQEVSAAYMKNKAALIAIEKEMEKLKQAAKSANDPKIVNDNIKKVAELEKKIRELETANRQLSENSKKSYDEAASGMTDLATAIDFAKEKLKTLDPDSLNFKKLSAEIRASEIGISVIGSTADATGSKITGLRKNLNDMVVALANMRSEGLQNTEVYKNLVEEAGILRDTIGDVQQEISSAGSDTEGIENAIGVVQVLAGGFAVVQGTEALFGAKSEELEKTLVKLNGVMAILNGLQAVQAELTKASTFFTRAATVAQNIYTAAVGTSTGAMKAFRIALLSTGIGALIVGVGLLISYMSSLGDESDETKAKIDSLKNTFENFDAAIDSFIKQNDRATKVAVAAAKARGATENEIFELENANRRKNARYVVDEINQNNERLKSKKLTAEEINAINERSQKLNDRLEDQNADGIIERDNFISERNKKAADAAKEASRKAQDLRTQKIKDEKDAAEKLLSIKRELSAAQIDLLQDGLAKEEATIKEQTQIRIAEIQNDIEQANIKLQNSKVNSSEELKAVAEANEERVKLIYTLQQVEAKALMDARLKNVMELSKQETSFEAERYNLQKDSLDKTIALIQNEAQQRLDAAKETYRKFPERYAEIETGIFDQRRKMIKDAIDANTKAEIDASEQAQIKIIEAITSTEKNETQVIRQKEKLLQQVQQQAASERFAALTKQYITGGGVLVENIAEQFSNENIAKAAGQGIDIFELLGVNFDASLTPEQLSQAKGAFSEAVKQYKEALKPIPKEQRLDEFYEKLFGVDKDSFDNILDSTKAAVNSILEVYSGFLKDRIELKQQEIDELSGKIDEAQSELDRELELQKAGYAANVGEKKAEVDALKQERDRALVEQRKAQKEEAQIAIASNAVALAQSVANVISAGAQIIKDYSKIPYVGWALGIAAAGSMVASFAALRSSIKNYQKLEKGGMVGGNRHSRGGNKYYSEDGSDLVEIEQGEYLTNREATKKRLPVLEAINKGASDADLIKLLAGTGAILSSQIKKQSLSDYKNNDNSSRTIVVTAGGNPENDRALNEIARNTAKMVDAEKNKVIREQHGDTLIEKRGKDIRIIKKTP